MGAFPVDQHCLRRYSLRVECRLHLCALLAGTAAYAEHVLRLPSALKWLTLIL